MAKTKRKQIVPLNTQSDRESLPHSPLSKKQKEIVINEPSKAPRAFNSLKATREHTILEERRLSTNWVMSDHPTIWNTIHFHKFERVYKVQKPLCSCLGAQILYSLWQGPTEEAEGHSLEAARWSWSALQKGAMPWWGNQYCTLDSKISGRYVFTPDETRPWFIEMQVGPTYF